MDIEKAKDLKTSPYWEDIVKELDFRVGLLTKELLACEPEELKILQAQIKVYQSFKNLPDQIINRLE